MSAIMQTAKQNAEILKMLKLHIGMGLEANNTEDCSLDIQIRIAEIETEFKRLISDVTAENHESMLDNPRIAQLYEEKHSLENQLTEYNNTLKKREDTKSRLDEIFSIALTDWH